MWSSVRRSRCRSLRSSTGSPGAARRPRGAVRPSRSDPWTAWVDREDPRVDPGRGRAADRTRSGGMDHQTVARGAVRDMERLGSGSSLRRPRRRSRPTRPAHRRRGPGFEGPSPARSPGWRPSGRTRSAPIVIGCSARCWPNLPGSSPRPADGGVDARPTPRAGDGFRRPCSRRPPSPGGFREHGRGKHRGGRGQPRAPNSLNGGGDGRHARINQVVDVLAVMGENDRSDVVESARHGAAAPIARGAAGDRPAPRSRALAPLVGRSTS